MISERRGVPSLLTSRLVGERIAKTNLDDVRRLQRDAEYMRYEGGTRSEAQVADYLDRTVAHWNEHGFGTWILHDRTTGTLAGMGGLHHREFEGAHEVEVGYGLIPELWGLGLATEVATACLKFAHGHLRLPSVVACAGPENVASIRVMQKTGFTFDRDVVTPGGPGVLYRFRFEAE